MGTISFGGKIKDSNETLEAEKPKPLNPLTNEAKKTTPQKKIKCGKLKFIVSRYSMYYQIILSDYTLHKSDLNDKNNTNIIHYKNYAQ